MNTPTSQITILARSRCQSVARNITSNRAIAPDQFEAALQTALVQGSVAGKQCTLQLGDGITMLVPVVPVGSFYARLAEVVAPWVKGPTTITVQL